MRDRNPLPNGRTADFFSLHEDLKKLLGIQRRMMRNHALDHFFQHGFLVPPLEVGDNAGVVREEVLDLQLFTLLFCSLFFSFLTCRSILWIA
jgi:hypothetical protein